MLDAVDEAAPACFDDPLLEHGIRRDNVRRRDDVEDLAGRERNHVFMMTVHALYARRGGVPPLLGQQKCLHEKIIGLFPPGRVVEAAVLGQRLDCGKGVGIAGAPGCIISQSHIFATQLGSQLQLPARRDGEMERPVRPCLNKRCGRQAMRCLSHHRSRCVIERLGEAVEGVGLVFIDRHAQSPAAAERQCLRAGESLCCVSLRRRSAACRKVKYLPFEVHRGGAHGSPWSKVSTMVSAMRIRAASSGISGASDRRTVGKLAG